MTKNEEEREEKTKSPPFARAAKDGAPGNRLAFHKYGDDRLCKKECGYKRKDQPCP